MGDNGRWEMIRDGLVSFVLVRERKGSGLLWRSK